MVGGLCWSLEECSWVLYPWGSVLGRTPYLSQVYFSMWGGDLCLFCSAFFSSRFTVLTILSASPFDCAQPGLEWVSFIPEAVAKLLISVLANETWSHTSSLAIQFLANTAFILLMTVCAVLHDCSHCFGNIGSVFCKNLYCHCVSDSTSIVAVLGQAASCVVANLSCGPRVAVVFSFCVASLSCFSMSSLRASVVSRV